MKNDTSLFSLRNIKTLSNMQKKIFWIALKLTPTVLHYTVPRTITKIITSKWIWSHSYGMHGWNKLTSPPNYIIGKKKIGGHHGLKSKLKKYFNLHPEFLLDISSLLMQVENKNYIQISKMNVHESKNDTSWFLSSQCEGQQHWLWWLHVVVQQIQVAKQRPFFEILTSKLYRTGT